jgi:UDP-N-acetyl-D-mannosaminuronic acid dehydrogenase
MAHETFEESCMTQRDPSICVVGTGHIGLPLAAVLADAGFRVTGYDTNDEFITRARMSRTVDFFEAGLDELLRKHLDRGLVLSSSPPADHDVYILTVGTPLRSGSDRPNLEAIRQAMRQIAPGFGDDPLVILRSTVTVGTTRGVVLPEILRRTDRFGLAFCPERTIEGKAIEEMRSLPQIVGALDDRSADRAEALFRTITPRMVRVSSLEAAEMIKLINNTYRDVTFAFANEVALIAEQLGLVASELIGAANLEYPRSSVPRPGFVGGPCLEKDAMILTESLRQTGFAPRVIGAAREVNRSLPDHVAQEVLTALRQLGRPLTEAKVLISGFAFKGRPATEDVRGSAAVPILGRLQAEGIDVWGHDFVTPEKMIVTLGARCGSLSEGFAGADAVIVMNNHPDYQTLDIGALADTMRRPALLFDSWHVFDRDVLRRRSWLRYGSIGERLGGA